MRDISSQCLPEWVRIAPSIGTRGSRILRFSLGAVPFHWLPWWLSGKESTCNAEDAGLIPGWGRSPGRGHGNPFQYSFLENPHGQRSLAGYGLWGRKELETTERLSTCTWARHPVRDPQTAQFPTYTELVIQSGKATLNQ